MTVTALPSRTAAGGPVLPAPGRSRSTGRSGLVSSGDATEGGSVPGPRLVGCVLLGAELDARDFGEEVGAAVGDLAQLGHRGGGRRIVGLVPAGVALRSTGQLRN